jgi:hypothetical protein
MAQLITRLMPNRTIAEGDKINEYSLNTASGEAGTFVKVVAGDLSKDPVQYVNSSYFVNEMGFATSQYPEVTRKVGVVNGALNGTGAIADAPLILGMILNDVRNTDENGEKLHFYPQKKAELQCVVSGEAVPIATRGIVDLFVPRALAGGVVPNVNDLAVIADNGKVTGVAASALTALQAPGVVGKFIGTGNRESQQTPDALAGAYARLKFSV